MSTPTDRLISCIDLCKRYKFENAVKKCNDYCTHLHLLDLFTKRAYITNHTSLAPPLVSPVPPLGSSPAPSRSV
jgi:hypothetical protein